MREPDVDWVAVERVVDGGTPHPHLNDDEIVAAVRLSTERGMSIREAAGRLHMGMQRYASIRESLFPVSDAAPGRPCTRCHRDDAIPPAAHANRRICAKCTTRRKNARKQELRALRRAVA